MNRPRRSHLPLMAAALLGLSLGACGGTLYDPDRIPVVSTGGQTCNLPTQHECPVGTVATCKDNTDPDFCGTDC